MMSDDFASVPHAQEPTEADIVERPGDLPKRRGRKPKNAAPEAATMGADENTAPEAADDQPKKRRARKASGEKVDALARQVFGFHQVIATLAQQPLLAIKEQEAKALAIAGLDLANEFDLEVGGKYATLISFIATAGMIYLPRGFIMMQMARAAKNTRVSSPPEPRPDFHNAPVDPSRHPFEDMPKVDPHQVN